MSTPTPSSAPDLEDLRALARGLRQLVEIGARTLTEDAGPSELALRVTAHLGCELPAVVPVTERFPSWENVNVQRGVDAYLAARHSAADWFGAAGVSHRPHEDMPVLRGSHFAEVLAEMNSEHHALTRALLGAGADAGDPAATDPRHRGRKVRL